MTSTVSRSNSATLSQEDAETIPHSTDHTVPQSNKTTDSQGNKGTASRPIRTTAPQNTVEPVQQDTADTTPQENTENLDQIDLLANGYDPFKEFADSAEDCNDKKSEEQSAVSAFPQNNEETREQGKGPEEYDPFEQFDLQSDDSSEPTTEQNERRDDNIIQDSSADSKKNVDMQEQGDIETVFPSNVPMQNQWNSETEEQYDSSSFQQEDSPPVRQDTGETYPRTRTLRIHSTFGMTHPNLRRGDHKHRPHPPEALARMITQRKHSRREMTFGARRTTNRTVSGIQASKRMACPRNNSIIRHSHRKMSSQLNTSMIPHPQETLIQENRGNGGTLIKIIAVAARHTHTASEH